MKLYVEKHDSTEYLYLCSSNRIDGKQHPITTKKYVGIIDSKTGLVTPKKVPPEAFLAQIYDREFSSADLGRIILARHAAESIGMFEFLKSRFPDKANVIYAVVLSLVADPHIKSDIVRHISKFYLDEILGTSTITSKLIIDTLNDFHKDLMKVIQRTSLSEQKCVFVLKKDTNQRSDKVIPGNVIFFCYRHGWDSSSRSFTQVYTGIRRVLQNRNEICERSRRHQCFGPRISRELRGSVISGCQWLFIRVGS